jgi:lysophospholipase L1-like esterase
MGRRTFSVLGDSISTFIGCNPEGNEVFYPRTGFGVNTATQTWWSMLADRLDLALLCNDSYSGSRVSRTGTRPPSSCYIDERRQKRLGGDLIIVFGGTNDWGQTEQPTTLEIFAHAYRQLIEAMRERHRQSTLFFCTPLQRTDRSLTTPNATGWTQLDLAETVRDIVREYPDTHLIDLGAYPIRVEDELLPDGVHPNPRGMNLIASLMKAAIKGI